jgi:lipopolysaccharide transport system ATP-binding protein
MNQPAIRVQGLSKRYVIGAATAKYQTLRETITDLMAAPVRRMKRDRRGGSETLWALRDVTFDVRPGEIVGIVGRNGAGKSTLLKILSHISDPSEGRVEILGRVAALLEVGTGFHLELTGRENIFLNGAILGMRREEIRRKFDEIVEFAGVSRFLDTPVKRFSSGMHVRLAFAVAAHLEPDVLLIDEVLAVGDAEFQKKCLGKMENVAGEGRTVLFVSHNLGAVSRLCKRGVYLCDGRFGGEGPISDILARYRRDIAGSMGPAQTQAKELRICSVEILGSSAEDGVFAPFDPCTVRAVFDVDVPLEPLIVHVLLQDSQGRTCIHLKSEFSDERHAVLPGRHRVDVHIEALNLENQVYFLWVRLMSRNPVARAESEAQPLEVRSPRASLAGRGGAVVAVKWHWSLDTLPVAPGSDRPA